jgi:hypothetical protein
MAQAAPREEDRMTRSAAMPSRRTLALRLPALAAALLAGRGAAAAALPGAASLLVPGPDDGGIAIWSQRFAEALARGVGGTAVRLEAPTLGGPDGVTAANRFATTAAPDGRTLLALAGAAAQARLVGDPRARFDPAGWLPVCAAEVPAILVGRQEMPPPQAGGVDRPVRIGLGAPDHARSAALLALDLVGVPATPVLGLEPTQAEEALATGAVEAILLTGHAAATRMAALQARPWFSLHPGMVGPEASPWDLPGLGARLRAAPPPLLAALRCAAAALVMPAALVLPALTSANLVALWRTAAQRWLEEEARSAPSTLRLLPGPESASLLAALATQPPEATAAYRDWLRRRLGWKPE